MIQNVNYSTCYIAYSMLEYSMSYSGTLIELRAMNEVRDRQRREIRLYLTRQNTPFELITRIMKLLGSLGFRV